MRRIFYSLIIFSLCISSCSKGSKGHSYMNTKGVNKGKVASTSSSAKTKTVDIESNVDSEGYAYYFPRTRINYQGSAGMGMGGSYASTYYAGEDKKAYAQRNNPKSLVSKDKKNRADSVAYKEYNYAGPDPSASTKNDTSAYKQEWQQYNW